MVCTIRRFHLRLRAFGKCRRSGVSDSLGERDEVAGRFAGSSGGIAVGVNFLFMKVSLADVSPMVLGMLRFAFMLFLAVFFLKRLNVPWYWLAVYGLTISFGQFGLMFSAITMGLPMGLAALVAQAQVFITVLLAALLWREPIRLNQFYAMLTAAVGLVLIGVGQYRGAVAMLPLVVCGNAASLVLFSATSLMLYGAGGVAQQIGQLS